MGTLCAQRAFGRVLAALAGMASVAATVPATVTDQLITNPEVEDKEPRLSRGWLVWTLDPLPDDSRGSIWVRHQATGQSWELGAGCLPDVDVSSDGTSVRVAWLRWNLDGTWDIVSAAFDGTGFVETTLAADVGFADCVRVAGPLTVWTQPDESGRLAITVHDGTLITRLPGAGHAFRPELCTDADGGVTLVWDEYVPGSPVLDYEVCLAHWDGSAFAPAENLSQAPLSEDLAPDIVPVPDGGQWIAWQSNRGGTSTRAFVVRRLADGTLLLPEPYPPSPDPLERGLVDLSPDQRSTMRPRLGLDELGRPWLFVASLPVAPWGATVYDKQVRHTVYDGAAWSAPALLSTNIWEERVPAVEAAPGLMRVVYEVHSYLTRNSELAVRELPVAGSGAEPLLQPAAGEPLPATALGAPQLPSQRTLVVNGQSLRLLFADLHSHTFQSPDGMGERDLAVAYARDVAQLDALAVSDHDDRAGNPFLDWEYEHARGLLDLLQTPDFAIYTGFEWTNDAKTCLGEIIGHRAVFDSAHIYRYTSLACDELPEFYAAMLAEDAIGTPHHLGKFGGSTFLMTERQAQPVTEVASVHGIFEAELVGKLQAGARFGVTCAGDIHIGAPGTAGLAGVWLVDDGEPLGPALKDALRERQCFGVRRDGLTLHARINGSPTGAELVHSGDLLLQYALREGPGQDPLTLNVTRDGDWNAPVYERSFAPGQELAGVAVLPGTPDDAFYMVRVSAASTQPQDTLLWSSPVWIAADAPDAYPLAHVAPSSISLPAGTLLDPVLTATDPDGRTNLADIQLHVALDGDVLGTAPLVLLLDFGVLGAVPDGWSITLPSFSLPPGTWSFVLQVRDKQGQLAVAQSDLQILP